MDSNSDFDQLLDDYRAACGDIPESADFMPRLWMRIDGRRSFSLVFRRFARILVPASAAACLLLAALNMTPKVMSARQTRWATYTDALSADNNPERTYDANGRPENFPVDFRQ